MESNPSSEYKIRFIDCDPLGHLTNSRYIDYMLIAREDHVNQYYQLDYEVMARKTGCTWVTLQNQISYFKEVRYGAKVRIDSKLIRFTEKTALVEIQMRNLETNKLHAFLWTEVIYFDLKTRKSAPHTQEILDLFQPVLVPVKEQVFQERVQTLLAER